MRERHVLAVGLPFSGIADVNANNLKAVNASAG
jgi:hypothetical protein